VAKCEACGHETPDARGLSAWIMFDNHTFGRLHGKTPSALVKDAERIFAERGDGALCPLTVLDQNGKELRRVCAMVFLESDRYHAGANGNPLGGSIQVGGKAAWIKAAKADADVMRLLSEGCCIAKTTEA